MRRCACARSRNRRAARRGQRPDEALRRTRAALRQRTPARQGGRRRVASTRRGETLGLVGESGCGKSTLGRAALRLDRADRRPRRLSTARTSRIWHERALRALRRDMQIIFQDPYASLNPRMTVGADRRASRSRCTGSRARRRASRARWRELLDAVGLRPDYADRYPHEFSGGQRQRIGIARALAVEPSSSSATSRSPRSTSRCRRRSINLLVTCKQRARPDADHVRRTTSRSSAICATASP